MSDNLISEILNRSAEVKQKMVSVCEGSAETAAQMIAASMLAGGKLMFCGNGGSAGDSQHLAAEFVATLDHTKPRPGLPALALTTDTSFLTAYSNDFGFEGIFARQVQGIGPARGCSDRYINKREFEKCHCRGKSRQRQTNQLYCHDR